jgi:DNA-binding winged helix-turn-helix (wHTH) protein
MQAHKGMVKVADCDDFEFDYIHNTIYFRGRVIGLSPHEADILHILLSNRARPTPVSTLIRQVYGANEPDAAAASIRVAIHSLRKKIHETGMSIKAEPRVGYEIDATHIPELNRRLPDKILVALNVARSNHEDEIVKYLETALNLAEAKRQKWINQGKPALSSAIV